MKAMGTDKILTIVIPTYNMEKYLRYCLDSLCCSSCLGALEILVINDGSKDSSSAIAHEYEQKYSVAFRVIDKKNGNYGSCVNRGLSEATGKYIKILDADDSFDTSNLERFVNFLQQTDADLVLSDFAVVDSDRVTRKIIKYRIGKGSMLPIEDVCATHVFKNMQMHAVTYKRKNLLDFGYKQTEGISYTDQQWIFIPMLAVKTVVCFDGCIYKYLVGRAGQTVNPDVKLKSVNHTLRCGLDMAVQYEQHKVSFEGKIIQEYLDARIIPFIKDVYVFSLTHYDGKTQSLLVDFDNELKGKAPYIYRLIGSKEVSSFHGFEYINYWRTHKNANITVVRLLSKAYAMLLKVRQKEKMQDEMYLPVSF